MGAIVAAEASGRPGIEGFMAGYERALLVAAFIAFAGSIVAFALVRQEAATEEPAADGGRSLSTFGKIRLPAAERRQAIVEAAMTVFSTGSYSGATTADIAREAGVSEPILYRHFASKRELYFACLDEAWRRLRQVFDEKVARTSRADRCRRRGRWRSAFGETAHVLPPNLWIQALTEAGEDPEIARYLRRHMRDVHDFMADGIRRSQAAGGDRRRPRS